MPRAEYRVRGCDEGTELPKHQTEQQLLGSQKVTGKTQHFYLRLHDVGRVDPAVVSAACQIGKPAPLLDKKGTDGIWRPYCRKQQLWKIAVLGLEEEGRKLSNCNANRNDKVTLEQLIALPDDARLTVPLRDLCRFLGMADAEEDGRCPVFLKETAEGWVPLKEAPRAGANMTALRGTGAPAKDYKPCVKYRVRGCDEGAELPRNQTEQRLLAQQKVTLKTQCFHSLLHRVGKVDGVVARAACQVGEPAPLLDKKGTDGIWRPYCRKQQFQKIAVAGLEEKGRKLSHFNRNRNDRITLEQLIALPDDARLTGLLRDLCRFLGMANPEKDGLCPVFVKETADGWVSLKEAPRLGAHNTARRGTGDPAKDRHWYGKFQRGVVLIHNCGPTAAERVERARALCKRGDTPADVRIVPEPTSRTKAEALFQQGGGQTLAQHMDAFRYQPQPSLLFLADWPEFKLDQTDPSAPLKFLKAGGCVQVRNGVNCTSLQIYHRLEFLLSCMLAFMAGTTNGRNLLRNAKQQFDSTLNYKFYCKAMPRGDTNEVCLAWGVLKYAFVAFERGLNPKGSGEQTFFGRISGKAAQIKEAVQRDEFDGYFRLVAPKPEQTSAPPLWMRGDLVAADRIISDCKGMHCVSNTKVTLRRISPVAVPEGATDMRFQVQANHQSRQARQQKHTPFHQHDLAGTRRVLGAFFTEVHAAMTDRDREQGDLPPLPTDFDEVTPELTALYNRWLYYPWGSFSGKATILRKWKDCLKRKACEISSSSSQSSSSLSRILMATEGCCCNTPKKLLVGVHTTVRLKKSCLSVADN